jgi:hypothetical protein
MKTLRDLRDRQCRYPLKFDQAVEGLYLFCAEVTQEDRVYCDRHWKNCCIAPTPPTGLRFEARKVGVKA